MSTQELNPVIVTEEDYKLLLPFINRMPDKNEMMSLAHELKRAIVVKREAFPKHCIRLGSKVSVLDLHTQKTFEFTIVMPENADIKLNRISVLTPMGTALIGFRKSEEVKWKVPAGLKRFRILDVTNTA